MQTSLRLCHRSWRPARRLAFLLVLPILAGCLPSACQRNASRALFPADSLSRRVAAEAPLDTLRLVWRSDGSEEQALQFPRTVQFGTDSTLYVSDAERDRVFLFSDTGRLLEVIAAPSFEMPYLAGWRGDTLAVFSPPARRVDLVAGRKVVDSLLLQLEHPPGGEPLMWVTAAGTYIYAKVLGEDVPGYIARLDRQGRVLAQRPLPGPAWRHAGRLRLWGDTLVSLSGYRPVVDLFPAGTTFAEAPLDTMALVGFDSPMLARSRSFVLDEVSEPPLLSESAVPVEGRLFVLNMRTGRLQVDVFDRQGRLQRRLVQAAPSLVRNLYPRDLAVRRRSDGSYDLAVVFSDPEPMLRLYRWRPQSVAAVTRDVS